MPEELRRIAIKDLYSQENKISVTPPAQPLSKSDQYYADKIQSCAQTIGSNQLALLKATDDRNAADLLRVCKQQNIDCFIINGQDILISGDSAPMRSTKSIFEHHISHDNNRDYMSVPKEIGVDTVAHNVSGCYQSHAMLELALQSNREVCEFTQVLYLPPESQQYAEAVTLIANGNMQAPIVLTGQPGGQFTAFMGHEDMGELIMPGYEDYMTKTVTPGIDAFTFANENNMEAFLNHANQTLANEFEKRLEEGVDEIEGIEADDIDDFDLDD